MKMESYLLLLYVTFEQEKAIKELFEQHSWLFSKVGLGDIVQENDALPDEYQLPPNFASLVEGPKGDNLVNVGLAGGQVRQWSKKDNIWSLCNGDGIQGQLTVIDIDLRCTDLHENKTLNVGPEDGLHSEENGVELSNSDKRCGSMVDSIDINVSNHVFKKIYSEDFDTDVNVGEDGPDTTGISDFGENCGCLKSESTEEVAEKNERLQQSTWGFNDIETLSKQSSTKKCVEFERAERKTLDKNSATEHTSSNNQKTKWKKYDSPQKRKWRKPLQANEEERNKNKNKIVKVELKKEEAVPTSVETKPKRKRKECIPFTTGPQGERIYTCPDCSKVFFQRCSFTRHTNLHFGSKKYVCDQCGKAFPIMNYLTQHKLSHSEERTHTCTICYKSFRRPATLKRHIILHSGSRSFTCDECGQRFASDSNLHAHKKSHSGVKTHVCSVCGKTFVRSTTLRVHMRIHLNQRPYKCDICPKAFRQSDSLKVHMRTHTGEKPYTCAVCAKSFNHSYNFKRHVKMHLKSTSQDRVQEHQ